MAELVVRKPREDKAPVVGEFSRAELSELQSRLFIDKNKLDDEICEQPGLFHKVGESLAYARSRMEEAKETQDTVYSRRFVEIKDEESKSGKATDKMVEALTETDPEYLAACKEHRAASLEVGILAPLVEAYKQRGFLIRDLALLTKGDYNSSDSIDYEKNKQRIADARRERYGNGRENE